MASRKKRGQRPAYSSLLAELHDFAKAAGPCEERQTAFGLIRAYARPSGWTPAQRRLAVALVHRGYAAGRQRDLEALDRATLREMRERGHAE